MKPVIGRQAVGLFKMQSMDFFQDTILIKIILQHNTRTNLWNVIFQCLESRKEINTFSSKVDLRFFKNLHKSWCSKPKTKSYFCFLTRFHHQNKKTITSKKSLKRIFFRFLRSQFFARTKEIVFILFIFCFVLQFKSALQCRYHYCTTFEVFKIVTF